jgi:dCTP deaminase
MSFWDDGRWQIDGAANKIIEPFDKNRIEDAKYMLSIGDEVYVSEEEGKKTAQRLKEGESFAIDPGQFAFVLTEEIVRVPFGVLGFISIRATIKFLGLVNISGFHVDPGYEGRLVFSVFNAGPTRIQLKRGDVIFSIWLADLNAPISRTKVITGYKDIPSKLITPISGKFTTAYQLEKEVDTLKDDIANLKAFRLQALVFLAFATPILVAALSFVGKDFYHWVVDRPAMTNPASNNSAPPPPRPQTK